MEHGSVQPANWPDDLDHLMNSPPIKTAGILVEEPDVSRVGSGATVVPQRPAQEDRWDVDTKCDLRDTLRERLIDLACQGRSHFLVRIDTQDPGLRCLFDAKVLLRPVPRPGMAENARSQITGQLPCPVRAPAVHDDPLGGPLDAA
jgi:hypothetical protein